MKTFGRAGSQRIQQTKPPCRGTVARANTCAVREEPALFTQVLASVASVGAAFALFLSNVPAAHAVTAEQLLFLEAWRAVDRAYVDKGFNGQAWFKLREQYLKQEPMRDREETYAAVRKMLATLDDPFTRFLEPERYAQLRRGAQGSVTGVGLEVGFSQDSATAGELLVVAPAEGGPAQRGGIRAGDALLAIDSVPTKGESLYDVADQLQGERGSSVTLTIRPVNSRTTKDITLVRAGPDIIRCMLQSGCDALEEEVHAGLMPLFALGSTGVLAESGSAARTRWCFGIPCAAEYAVRSEACGSVGKSVGALPGASVGYVRISTFNKQTASAFLEQLQDLKRRGVSEFVLDLRNNGGGYFPSGVQVARYLIPQGDIVLIADSKGVKDIYSSDATVEDGQSRLSVLVNRGTASASEVLAAALQDNLRATIVGETTFGKGLIQTVVPLDPDDGSAVVVTVARYQTPLGKDINKKGIKPDLPLDDLAVPSGSEDVCRFLKAEDAPQLFV